MLVLLYIKRNDGRPVHLVPVLVRIYRVALELRRACLCMAMSAVRATHPTSQCPFVSPLQLHIREYSADELALARLGTHKANISRCVNLAPAGTGTGSLYEQLSTTAPGGPWHHMHENRIRDLQGRSRDCFILTVRDPAARLESAFRHELSNKRPVLGMSSLYGQAYRELSGRHEDVLSREPRSITHFIDALRDTTNPYHANVMRYYLSSVSWPAHFNSGVNAFLISQLDYLRDLNPQKHSLIFICTEHFQTDWQRLADRVGFPSTSSNVTHVSARASLVSRKFANMSKLRPEDADFVRRCLYPWDTWLHAHICAAGAGGQLVHKQVAEPPEVLKHRQVADPPEVLEQVRNGSPPYQGGDQFLIMLSLGVVAAIAVGTVFHPDRRRTLQENAAHDHDVVLAVRQIVGVYSVGVGVGVGADVRDLPRELCRSICETKLIRDALQEDWRAEVDEVTALHERSVREAAIAHKVALEQALSAAAAEHDRSVKITRTRLKAQEQLATAAGSMVRAAADAAHPRVEAEVPAAQEEEAAARAEANSRSGEHTLVGNQLRALVEQLRGEGHGLNSQLEARLLDDIDAAATPANEAEKERLARMEARAAGEQAAVAQRATAHLEAAVRVLTVEVMTVEMQLEAMEQTQAQANEERDAALDAANSMVAQAMRREKEARSAQQCAAVRSVNTLGRGDRAAAAALEQQQAAEQARAAALERVAQLEAELEVLRGHNGNRTDENG